ncbi:MAG TPA: MFS transporter [Candidatus Angelobacter sp.]|nr:MFS transporter [Candidatus Angelobacter sp.]
MFSNAAVPVLIAQERADRRNAVLSGFLGWTFDAFDFFILVMLLDVVAKDFGRTRPQMAVAISATLWMRPVGAILFGMMADRFGRRLPLMLNIVFFSVVEVLSGLAPNYTTFFILRLLFGIGMGGEWGVGASLALESVPAKWRGILSGLLQEGYAFGYMLAAGAYFLVYPYFEHAHPNHGWRYIFFVGGLPALLSLFVRAKVKDPEAWHRSRTDWSGYRRVIFSSWRRLVYLAALMTMMVAIAHGTQDMYPTFLKKELLLELKLDVVKWSSLITIFSMVGAIIGGIVVGKISDHIGRRRAMILAVILAICLIPLWVGVHSLPLVFLGAFLMQFMIQGAWGVIPAHINELSPGASRGFFPGFAYQTGALLSSGIGVLEASVGEKFTYSQSLTYSMLIVMIVGGLVIWFGPEDKGVHFG